MTGFVTGWCNEQEGHPPALHYLCHHTYVTRTDQTYVCGCSCHNGAGAVRKVSRRAEPSAPPPEAGEAPTEAPPVHAVQRRPAKQRRQVRRV